MAKERYEVRMVRANPNLYAVVWVTEEGTEIIQEPEINEVALRASFKMNRGRTDEDVDQLIAEAQGKFVA